jgi:hypothetical protein
MRKLYFLLFALFMGFAVNAQISVTVTGSTNTTPNLQASYTSLAAALTDLNAVTAMSGPVVLTCTGGGSETTPATGLTVGSATLNPVLSSTNTVTLNTSGGTAVLNAGVGTATPGSAAPDGILKLVGADYVTIDGLTFTDGNAANPATMEFGIALFKRAAGDGSNNNTIQNCAFNMQRINNATGTAPMIDGAVGILVINSIPAAAATGLTPTNGGTLATNGTNSGNKFYTNTINGGNIGVGLSGFAASAGVGPTPTATTFLGDLGNDVGGSSNGTGNTILNYGGGAATNPAAGIRANNQWSVNISYNTVNNNNGSGVNHATTLRGIYAQAGTSANASINNNTVTVNSAATTSASTGIDNVIGSTAASNTVNINNNTVQNCTYSTATTATFTAILNGATAATVNTNNNTISNNTVGTIGSANSCIFQGIYSSVGATNYIANGNTIANNTINNQGGTMYCLRGSTSLLTWNNNNINNNSFSSTGAALSASLYGMYNLSSPTQENFANNSINNLTISGATTSTSSTIVGMNFNTSSASVKNWSGNVINTLTFNNSSTGTATVNGMSQSLGTANIFKNKIYDLTANGAGSTVNGILITSGTNISVYNNLIGDLKAPGASAADAIRGISSTSTTGTSSINISFNSIYINATSSGSNFGTSGIFHTTSTTATTATLNLRSNIIVNTSTRNGTGLIVAYRRSSTTLTNYGTVSNNNLFYAGTPSASNLIFYDGTNADQTLAAFKTRVAPRENVSVSENPTFISTTGSSSGFLHINTTTPTAIEGGGTSVSGITDDYDGDARAGTPDIGADEFAGVSSTPACTGTPAPGNTQSTATNVCATTSFTLSIQNVPTGVSGITYQWQSSPDGVTYSNIAGATLSTYTTTQSASIYYQLIVGCTPSGQSATSNPIQVVQNPVSQCYCSPSNGTTLHTAAGSCISVISINTLSNNSGTACAVPSYTAYPAASFTTNLAKNQTYPITVTISATGIVSVWIDYNQNGVFEAAEWTQVYTSATTGTVNITIPNTALTGQTGMRVRSRSTGSPNGATDACTSFASGETEDYIVTIDPAPTNPCVAPTDQASVLTFGTIASTAVPGSFTAATSAPTGYLVVRSIGALNTTPVDATSYAAGNTLGNGTVVQSSSSLSFNATGLTGNTDYTFTIFAFNNTFCLGGPAYNTGSPLTGNTITCPATPGSITTSNITQTSFDLNWASSLGGGASAVSYTIEIATDNAFASLIAGSPFTVNDPTVTLSVTGLNPATTYFYHIRANGSCNSAFSTTSSVATACNVFTTPTAAPETFATYLPNCWTEAAGLLTASTAFSSTTTSTWIQDDFGNVLSPVNKAARVNIFSTTTDEWLMTPSYDLGTGGNLQLEFDLAYTTFAATTPNTLGTDDKFVVLISTDNGATWSSANALRTWTSATPISNTGEHITINLSAYTGVVRFAFYGESTVSNADNDLFVDNFAINVIPTCQPPTGLVVTPSATTADLNWTASASSPAGGYEWEVRTSGAAGSGLTGLAASGTTAAGVISATASGLSGSTSYTLYVRASCGGGDFSPWASSTFTTTLANDEATSAIALTVGAGCTGAAYTNVGATKSTNEVYPLCSGTAQTPVWFKFVATSSAVRITTDVGTGNTLTDSKMALFSATDPSNYSTFSIISCDDDGGNVLSSGFMSVVYATGLTVGNTYYIAVDKYQASTTNGTFCITVDDLATSMLSTTNTCASTFQTPINNTNTTYTGWVPLLDGTSKLIALVRNPAGGSVASYVPAQNINTAAIRQNAGIYYLDRNYMINNSSATNVDVQFFFLNTELSALNAVNGATIGTIGVARQTGTTCRNNFATANGSTTFLPQTSNGSANGVSWIEVNTPSFSNFYIQAAAGAILPANLLTFAGQRVGSANQLKWTVAQEIDVKSYEVERSENGRTWSKAGSVVSLGNTASQRTYGFIDNNINGVKQYYRLRQVDRNGSEKLSNIVVISGVKPTMLTLNGLFPNPAISKVNMLIDVPVKDNVTIIVMDAVGRVVKTQKGSVEAGSNTLQLNVTGLSQGSYLVKITCESNNETAVSKFIKE